MPTTAALPAAVQWLQAVLLGTVGTTLAVISVAWLGLEMLGGRISVRRGLQVVLGCFILFGAPAIVAGMLGTFRGGAIAMPPSVVRKTSLPPVLPSTPKIDPYAGAAVNGVAVKPG